MRGADYLVKTLAKAGVSRLFSLSGNQVMPVYDACLDAGIDIVHTRHEAAAVFMAEAYAQLTGEVGIALVTAGPGFSNALGPLVAARASESPVLLLSGDAPLGLDGWGGFQELPQTTIASSLTKGSFRATTAERLGEDVMQALKLAAGGRPGPAHLALPIDVLEANFAAIGDLSNDLEMGADDASPRTEDVETLLANLGHADRPLLLTGPALNKTRFGEELDQLGVALDTPVIPMESPRGLKDASLGNLAGVLKRADLILCLGKSIDFALGFGAHDIAGDSCHWMVVDAENEASERACRHLGERLIQIVQAEPRSTARALIAKGVAAQSRRAWHKEVEAGCRSEARADTAQAPMSGKISSDALCAAVQQQIVLQSSSVAVLDGGEFGQWAQAGIRADERLTNGPAGAIGGGMCYAIAAKLARPEATVFALMGDGSAGFHLAEFETARRIGTPFVAVIGNDACWNAEHQIQLRDYGPDRLIGCELSAARYDLAAEGLGGHGEFVTDLGELDAALERAIAAQKPACVNVQIEGLPAPGGVPH
ncbi:MAG: thiamine pyrophosphate-binding protein [Geminicoccales bacterium]